MRVQVRQWGRRWASLLAVVGLISGALTGVLLSAPAASAAVPAGCTGTGLNCVAIQDNWGNYIADDGGWDPIKQHHIRAFMAGSGAGWTAVLNSDNTVSFEQAADHSLCLTWLNGGAFYMDDGTVSSKLVGTRACEFSEQQKWVVHPVGGSMDVTGASTWFEFQLLYSLKHFSQVQCLNEYGGQPHGGSTWLIADRCGSAANQNWRLAGEGDSTAVNRKMNEIAIAWASAKCGSDTTYCRFDKSGAPLGAPISMPVDCSQSGGIVQNTGTVNQAFSVSYSSTTGYSYSSTNSFSASFEAGFDLGDITAKVTLSYGFSATQVWSNSQTSTTTASIVVPPGQWGYAGLAVTAQPSPGTWTFDQTGSDPWTLAMTTNVPLTNGTHWVVSNTPAQPGCTVVGNIQPSVSLANSLMSRTSSTNAALSVYEPAAIGDRLTYQFQVTNSGAMDLISVGVAASVNNGGGAMTVTCPAGTLVAAGTVNCTGTHVVSAADVAYGTLTVTATASGRSAALGTTGTSASNVVNTPIAAPPYTPPGADVSAEYAATHPSSPGVKVTGQLVSKAAGQCVVAPAAGASLVSQTCSPNTSITGSTWSYEPSMDQLYTVVDHVQLCAEIGQSTSAAGIWIVANPCSWGKPSQAWAWRSDSMMVNPATGQAITLDWGAGLTAPASGRLLHPMGASQYYQTWAFATSYAGVVTRSQLSGQPATVSGVLRNNSATGRCMGAPGNLTTNVQLLACAAGGVNPVWTWNSSSQRLSVVMGSTLGCVVTHGVAAQNAMVYVEACVSGNEPTQQWVWNQATGTLVNPQTQMALTNFVSGPYNMGVLGAVNGTSAQSWAFSAS